MTKEPSWGDIMDSFDSDELTYVIAHKGLFQRAPMVETDVPLDQPQLWRAVLDRALLDYRKGPHDVGEVIFSEVSVWMYDKENTGDFETICAYAGVDEKTVFQVFVQCRYERLPAPSGKVDDQDTTKDKT